MAKTKAVDYALKKLAEIVFITTKVDSPFIDCIRIINPVGTRKPGINKHEMLIVIK